MNKDITLEDIRKAMKHLEENQIPKQKKEYSWGWVESDEHGLPGTIGFSKESMESIKKLLDFNNERTKGNFKVKKVMGIDVVEDLNE